MLNPSNIEGIKRARHDKENMAKKKKIKLLQDCLDQVPNNARLLGLDLGSKTIGMAISDAGQSLATPIGTIKRTKFSKDIVELLKTVQEFEVGGIILGWPVQMDGRTGARCDMVASFADELFRDASVQKAMGNPPFIALQDERLSTQSVDNFLDNRVDMKRKSKINAKDSGLKDALAAQIILQTALDGI